MEEETCDIVNQMFYSDLDEILQKVFLFLDPVSLKDARCVCHQWNQFIKNRLWGSSVARKKLKSRLCYRWKNESNVRIENLTITSKRVYFLTCDEEFVFSGTMDGFVEVFSISTGHLVHQLDCKNRGNEEGGYEGVDVDEEDSDDNMVDEEGRDGGDEEGRDQGDEEAQDEVMVEEEDIYNSNTYTVQLDVGDIVIASICGLGNICVWNKRSGDKLYQAKHHGSSSVFGIKVATRDAVLTGAGDGSLGLVMNGREDNRWSLVHKFTDLKEEITHMDSDGDWVVTGTRSAVHLWSLTKQHLVLDPRSVQVKVWMLTFSFPFIFIVGGETWSGLQVWNIDTMKMVRHVDFNDRKFHNIHSNGRFLTISEIYDGYEDDHDCFVFILDEKELCNPKIPEDKLWRKIRICEHSHYFSLAEVNAALNKTCLVVSNDDNCITLQNFWGGPVNICEEIKLLKSSREDKCETSSSDKSTNSDEGET